MIRIAAGILRRPVVVERWTLGGDIAEVTTLGGKAGWKVTMYRKRGNSWRREVRSFPTNREIGPFLTRRGFQKRERGPRR